MNGLRGCWKIIAIPCIFFLLISGCVTQPPPKNDTSTLSDIFSAPTGGFVHPEKYTIEDPNTTFESDYVFYSRDWSGEVKYSVFGKYKGQILNDSSALYVEPSSFTAEPYHVYTAKIYMNSSTLPKDFFITQPEWLNPNSVAVSFSPYTLYFNVSLDGTDSQFCNDYIGLESFFDKPQPAFNYIDVRNGSVSLKKGETKNFTIVYSPGWRTGLTEILYYFSDTPLNVTITPLRFIAQHNFIYPVKVTLTADSHLGSGNYPVKITLNGNVDDVTVFCDQCKESREKTFVVNVTVE
ncbi:MAG: hypothetical protein M0Q91_06720 [Methanoregula sp.]|jgi:hypothetical protein|nr:hypothetical protein [Methanoregula sp.]